MASLAIPTRTELAAKHLPWVPVLDRQFNNTRFVQNPAGGLNFAVGGVATGFAVIDTNHAGSIILNNCSLLAVAGTTNLLISEVNDANTNQGHVFVNGNFSANTSTFSTQILLDGSGTVVSNATWLTNYISVQ